MNQVMLVGRIVRDVHVKMVGDKRVVNNTLAVSRRHRNSNGEIGTDFIPISAWGNLADIMEKYCQKGQQVAITGKLQSRSYTNQMQQSVYVIECLVSEVTLLDGSRKGKVSYDEEYREVAHDYDVPSDCPID